MSNIISNIDSVLNVNSDEYRYLQNIIEDIRKARTSLEINTSFDALKRFLSRNFNINCTITMLNTINDREFFGFNIFPDTDTCRKMVDMILDSDTKHLDDVKNIWKENEKWHIDIDCKLFKDLSHPFTSKDIITLLLYKIDRVCLSQDIIELIYVTIRHSLLQLPYVANQIVRSNICRNIYIIPFIRGCSYTNFVSKLPDDSLLANRPEYNEIIATLIKFYGTTNLINRSNKEFIYEMNYNLIWIFEALNDLKYRMTLLKKTLREQILMEKSIYVKNILISIYKTFATYDESSFIRESAVPSTISPKKIEVEDTIKMNKILENFKRITESVNYDLIDNRGKACKISQEDIDVLRVECENISTTDDKLYYLSRCYKLSNIVDNALSMLQDKELAKKVTQSKSVLEKQKDQLEAIRTKIISSPLVIKRYGLYIDYPTNYKG